MLTEGEIISKHTQSLGEAHRACQVLGRNMDPTIIAPRGARYSELRAALLALEGSCRQMAAWRSDGRWLRLGVFYGKIARAAQAKFVGQRWDWFRGAVAVFERGERSMAELLEMRTGRLTNSPILPSRPSDWLVLPDHRPSLGPERTMH